jgi:hypothetical protein
MAPELAVTRPRSNRDNAVVPSVEDPRDRAMRICDERRILAIAREKTRCWQPDVVSDAAILHLLSSHLQDQQLAAVTDGRAGPMAESDDFVATALATEAKRVLRDHLVTVLVDRYDLGQIAADACSRAGIVGREPQLAYCLVVLCQKRDRPRSPAGGGPRQRAYNLDVGESGFPDQLRDWAAAVAANLRADSGTYAAIQDEADRCEVATLRRLIPVSRADDDVADAAADRVTDLLMGGQRLEHMSLAAARAIEPMPGEYVFQSPLPRWVRTTVGRIVRPPSEELDPGSDALSVGDEPDVAALARAEGHRRLVSRVAGLAATRDLLSAAWASAAALEQKAATMRFANAEESLLFQRFRAELAAVADELRNEQRSFAGMLAYLMLAMRKSAKRQTVAILSLRRNTLDRGVVAHIAGQLRAVVTGDSPPTPALIAKAESAPRALVPANRGKELRRLRDDARHRAVTFAGLGRLLDELPPVIGDLTAIGAAVPGAMTASAVGTTRGQALAELTAVDKWFGRSFRRYAMRTP